MLAVCVIDEIWTFSQQLSAQAATKVLVIEIYAHGLIAAPSMDTIYLSTHLIAPIFFYNMSHGIVDTSYVFFGEVQVVATANDQPSDGYVSYGIKVPNMKLDACEDGQCWMHVAFVTPYHLKR